MLFQLSLLADGAYLFTPVASAPAWVTALRAPSGDLPIIAADFKNGRYWNGSAECAVTDLFADSGIGNGFAASAITPGSGLSCAPDKRNSPVLVSALTGGLPTGGATGMTQVRVVTPVATGDTDPSAFNLAQTYFAILGADFSSEYYGGSGFQETWDGMTFSAPLVAPNTLNWYASSGSGGSNDPNIPGAIIGVHRQAVTVIPSSGIAASTDGGVVASLVSSTGTSLPDKVAFSFGCNPDGGNTNQFLANPCWAELAVIYTPQPNVDLPTLSTP